MDDNILKKTAEQHRKKQKGLPWYVKQNAGNVELNNELFNQSMVINASETPNISEAVHQINEDTSLYGALKSFFGYTTETGYSKGGEGAGWDSKNGPIDTHYKDGNGKGDKVIIPHAVHSRITAKAFNDIIKKALEKLKDAGYTDKEIMFALYNNKKDIIDKNLNKAYSKVIQLKHDEQRIHDILEILNELKQHKYKEIVNDITNNYIEKGIVENMSNTINSQKFDYAISTVNDIIGNMMGNIPDKLLDLNIKQFKHITRLLHTDDNSTYVVGDIGEHSPNFYKDKGNVDITSLGKSSIPGVTYYKVSYWPNDDEEVDFIYELFENGNDFYYADSEDKLIKWFDYVDNKYWLDESLDDDINNNLQKVQYAVDHFKSQVTVDKKYENNTADYLIKKNISYMKDNSKTTDNRITFKLKYPKYEIKEKLEDLNNTIDAAKLEQQLRDAIVKFFSKNAKFDPEDMANNYDIRIIDDNAYFDGVYVFVNTESGYDDFWRFQRLLNALDKVIKQYDSDAYFVSESSGYGKALIRNKMIESFENADEWEEVASKSVVDSDGFWTDYTWYKGVDEDGEECHIFMFGDKDIYGPDKDYADWETGSYESAKDWFDNYNGFEDDPFLENLKEDFALDKALTSAYKLLISKDQPFAVIYGYNFGDGVKYLDKPLAQPNQQMVHNFVKSLSDKHDGGAVDIKVLYQSNADLIRQNLINKGLLKESCGKIDESTMSSLALDIEDAGGKKAFIDITNKKIADIQDYINYLEYQQELVGNGGHFNSQSEIDYEIENARNQIQELQNKADYVKSIL